MLNLYSSIEVMTLDRIRAQFPELQETVYGKPLVYLDSAATSMRPVSVIEKWTEMSTRMNANIHRAVHHISGLATAEFETARAAVAQFIGAADASEIVFTSGATAAANLLAFSFGEACVREGDEILVYEAEHHSNIVPWQMMAARKGASVKVIPVVDETGAFDLAALESLISERTRIVCVSHISNVLGVINPVKEIVKVAHSKGVPVAVDGAQGVVHCEVNVAETDADFYFFSGHKLYAAPGTGVLYAKKKWLEDLPPYMGGGEMIDTVKWSGTTYARVPQKFEAGTQNIAGVPTLVPAIEMARSLRDPEIRQNEDAVKAFVMDALTANPLVHLYGRPAAGTGLAGKASVFSFTVDGAHHEDLALILDKMGVAVRSGQMCAEPLMDRFGVTGMVRASFAPFNTMGEAEYFIEALDRAVKMLR